MAARVFDFKLGGTPASDQGADFHAPRVGKIVHVHAPHEVLVEFGGSSAPVRARLALQLDGDQLAHVCSSTQPVLLVFEEGDPTKPIVVGLVATPLSSSLPAREPASPGASGLVIDADADGQRVRLSAKEEIVFQCGQASVTLMSSGRVIVRGTYVETHSTGTNRIKGGQVRIN